MLGFSLVRALSVRHLANFQNDPDGYLAEAEINKAIDLDPSEPMFRFYYGQKLYLMGRYDEAIPQMTLAIQNGLATSVSYFNLLAAEMCSGRQADANETFEEALIVHPRSVFLLTAQCPHF